MRALAVLCVLAIAAGCDGDGGTAAGLACETLPGGQLAGPLDVAPPQVNIEVRIVVANRNFVRDLGITWPLAAPVQTDSGGTLGGLSQQGRNVVVDSGTVGGPASVPYLVTDGFDGILSIVNPNFISPFAGQDVKVFPGLPFPGGCVRCADSATTPIQNFAGGSDAGTLAPIDPGLQGTLLHDILDAAALQELLDVFDDDVATIIVAPPVIRMLSEQRALLGLQDVTPQVSDLKPGFRSAVQSVVQNPFGLFTGFTLDVTPVVETNGMIRITFRPGTEMVSVFRSVPANVGAAPADVEIPFLAASTNYASIAVPDGQTVALAELLLQGATEPTDGLPLLGNIPLIGALFSHQISEPTEQSLVILITPRIIGDD